MAGAIEICKNVAVKCNGLVLFSELLALKFFFNFFFFLSRSVLSL